MEIGGGERFLLDMDAGRWHNGRLTGGELMAGARRESILQWRHI